MFNQSLQYLGEDHRNQLLNEYYRQNETEERNQEALQAQLAYRRQGQNVVASVKGQSHSPYGLLKAAFSHLPGHRVVTHAR